MNSTSRDGGHGPPLRLVPVSVETRGFYRGRTGASTSVALWRSVRPDTGVQEHRVRDGGSATPRETFGRSTRSANATGGLVGPTRVEITTGYSEQGRPETVPARYNKQSTLREEVESGSNTIDFALVSK